VACPLRPLRASPGGLGVGRGVGRAPPRPPPSPLLLGLAGLAIGYAVASEYPLSFVAVVLGLYLLSRRDTFTVLGVARRAGAYLAGGLIGVVPLLIYNHYAFPSLTHLAYSNVPRHHH